METTWSRTIDPATDDSEPAVAVVTKTDHGGFLVVFFVCVDPLLLHRADRNLRRLLHIFILDRARSRELGSLAITVALTTEKPWWRRSTRTQLRSGSDGRLPVELDGASGFCP